MIKEDTVFILGAGASCPYEFPDGKELRKKICNNFVKDSIKYFKQYETSHPNLKNLESKAEQFTDIFKKSTTKSIDLFLSRNRNFMDMGLYAIIFRILMAEKNSKFREETLKVDQDWYSYLFDKLTDDLVLKEDYSRLLENNVSFITFNYDRSLENFLFESYMNSFYEIERAKKLEKIKKLKIIHVFGQVSGLEWQDSDVKYIYGVDPYSVDVQRISEKLSVIYDNVENPKLEEAKDLIKKARRIFFLGFGFLPENLKLLDIPNILNRNQKIDGTGYNLEKEEIDRITKSIMPTEQKTQIFDNTNIKIEDCDCLKLLRKYL